ncbi:DUF2877 domain-containing protein [Erwinia sorbitola]|uniref:DUF2877 domain-containing protein n=1 Tax=Erwinia sorbitola TaxID=2681984 RepID=A0A6I6EQS6_9GAMM|nr:DUF2877 domain-containing protein [Erwinia sorbitola]MTD27038.1 DUF2877 domain-containing protein [Erwinia sorbitola]QGU88596.1 DUF2877 domain-containing protein [Erwinia sorbitola]
MEITALAVSQHASQDEGSLRCVGHFRHAINFLTSEERLLTLHRAGRGLSPMGWVIDEDDFDEVSDCLRENGACHLSATGIELANLRLCYPSVRQDLRLRRQGIISLPSLQASLAGIPASTGLFGPLDNIITHPCRGEPLEIRQLFSNWLRGENVDWSLVLGKGPGLTPGNDDTLMGMLLVAWLDQRVDVKCLPAFFTGTQPLAELTTLVSVHYLQFAAQGIFSTPLQQAAYALLHPEKLPDAVSELLAIGHFSGADTLLGIWLGAEAVNAIH